MFLEIERQHVRKSVKKEEQEQTEGRQFQYYVIILH